MKRWIALLGSLSAVAGVVALTLFLAGVFDSDDASGTDGDGTEVAGVCAPGFPDCEDTLVADGADDDEGNVAADNSDDMVFPVCSHDNRDCDDTVLNDNEADDSIDTDDGPVIQPVCAPGFPDCEDMIVVDLDGDLDDAEPGSDPIALVEGERDAIDAVLADAETQFGVDLSAIVVESASFQEWSNACLGAATDGELCAQVITPGFVIVLDIQGSQHEYHTDLNGNVRLAP
ncbi:MAG: hypothetical protein IH957_01960 [Chloroflexi bacterium]|nr:hypothetical protein [Chloroflexota bacterium]